MLVLLVVVFALLVFVTIVFVILVVVVKNDFIAASGCVGWFEV